MIVAEKVIVVDDEEDVVDLVTYKLESSGYKVIGLTDPVLLIGKAREFLPDIILLDVMMPEINGFHLCRMLRADTLLKDTPILFLSAKGDSEDRIKGLEYGADDYLSKPFDLRELMLRIQAIIKRSKLLNANKYASLEHRIEYEGVVVDSDFHQVLIEGVEVEFTAREFELLKLLLQRKGRVQSRESLLNTVWSYESDVETRTVDTHIRRIREKMGSKAELIQTVRGVGYRVAFKK
jgi:two-component system phosphate regulon response regulator PhoB